MVVRVHHCSSLHLEKILFGVLSASVIIGRGMILG